MLVVFTAAHGSSWQLWPREVDKGAHAIRALQRHDGGADTVRNRDQFVSLNHERARRFTVRADLDDDRRPQVHLTRCTSADSAGRPAHSARRGTIGRTEEQSHVGLREGDNVVSIELDTRRSNRKWLASKLGRESHVDAGADSRPGRVKLDRKIRKNPALRHGVGEIREELGMAGVNGILSMTVAKGHEDVVSVVPA